MQHSNRKSQQRHYPPPACQAEMNTLFLAFQAGEQVVERFPNCIHLPRCASILQRTLLQSNRDTSQMTGMPAIAISKKFTGQPLVRLTITLLARKVNNYGLLNVISAPQQQIQREGHNLRLPAQRRNERNLLVQLSV